MCCAGGWEEWLRLLGASARQAVTKSSSCIFCTRANNKRRTLALQRTQGDRNEGRLAFTRSLPLYTLNQRRQRTHAGMLVRPKQSLGAPPVLLFGLVGSPLLSLALLWLTCRRATFRLSGRFVLAPPPPPPPPRPPPAFLATLPSPLFLAAEDNDDEGAATAEEKNKRFRMFGGTRWSREEENKTG